MKIPLTVFIFSFTDGYMCYPPLIVLYFLETQMCIFFIFSTVVSTFLIEAMSNSLLRFWQPHEVAQAHACIYILQ